MQSSYSELRDIGEERWTDTRGKLRDVSDASSTDVIRERTADLVRVIRQEAEHRAARVSEAIDEAATTVGRSAEQAGDVVERSAAHTSQSFRDAGRYLQATDARGFIHDLTAVARKHPVATLCAGIVTGLLAASLRTTNK